jgi:predicted  nucleic acid-binding Zn-ribbon protein
MFPALEQLLVIQDRDRLLSQLRAEQKRIPEEIEELQEKLEAASSTLEQLKTQAKQAEADRKKWELEAETKRQLITKYRIQQAQVKKNEEYQALTHEIQTAEAAIREMEDRELEFMDTAEHIQRLMREEQAKLNELASLNQQRKSELEKRAAAITAQLATLETERAALSEQVLPELLLRYQRIMEKRRDYAIVRIEHDSCGGCHLRLPPQTVHTARGNRELAVCDFCGRLLYWLPQ